MGHTSNWSPRKREQVRAVNEAADRAHLREVTLYQHTAAALEGRLGPDFFRMNPCETFRVFRFRVHAVCMGCMAQHELTAFDLDDSPWAHRHWPVVMQELACPDCGSCPSELRFAAERGGEVGVISTSEHATLRVATASIGISRNVHSRGEIDPFAQHDDSHERDPLPDC